MADVPQLNPILTEAERSSCYYAIGEFLVRQASLEGEISEFIAAWMGASDTPFIQQIFGIVDAGSKKRMLDAIVGQLHGDKAKRAARTVSKTFGDLLEVRNILAHGLPYKHADRVVMSTLSAAAAMKVTAGVDKWVYLDTLPQLLVRNGEAFRHAKGLRAWITIGHQQRKADGDT